MLLIACEPHILGLGGAVWGSVPDVCVPGCCSRWPETRFPCSPQDHTQALPYYKRIASHYESIGNLEEAERYYIKAGMAMAAVEMYSRASKWVWAWA